MTANITNQVAYLKTIKTFPIEAEQLSVEINKAYVDIANAVNFRTIGIFAVNKPVVTGENFYILNNSRQQTLRQVYTFGSISPGTERDIPIGTFNFTQFSRIYGTVITNVVDYRPLPYVDPITLTTGIALLVGPIAGKNNIRIIVGATSPAITSGLVVLEWISPA